MRGNPPITGKFPSQRPVTRSFDVFVDLCLYKLWNKQSKRRWFETQPRSLWRHCNAKKPRNTSSSRASYWIPYLLGRILKKPNRDITQNMSSKLKLSFHCRLILLKLILKSNWQHVINDNYVRKHIPRHWPLVKGNPPITGKFPSQRPVTRSFDVFVDLCLYKRWNKQSKRRWFYSERPRGAGFRSVNPAERWRENPVRALARAGFSQHLECGIHRSESSPEGSFALIPRPVARWAKTTP